MIIMGDSGKRYKTLYNKYAGLVVADMNTNPRIGSAKRYSDEEIVDLLNNYDAKLTEIEEIVKNFDGYWTRIPKGYCSSFDGVYIVMNEMLKTIRNVEELVNNG